jgi:hypothetical protein
MATTRLRIWISFAIVLLTGNPALAAPPENRLRNGSFEGGLLYWHVEPGKQALVRGGAALGDCSLRIEKGWAMSAPFVCERGQPFTVSFSVKGDRDGEVRVQLPASAREEAHNARRLWTREASQSAKIGPDWKRVSFTALADIPPSGFWPHPHYTVLIEGTVPLQVDAVVASLGRNKAEQYVPRREIEVLSDCSDLPGYVGAGNLLEKGATVKLAAHASNPGAAPREVTLRWQFVDYEGERPIGKPVEKRVTIPAGGTVTETIPAPLPATGCVLSRVSALADGKEIDRSDLPLTSLPYPFPPRKPDYRERFGGSFFGPKSAALGSRIGFGWSRWYPHTKWQDHQPKGPDDWVWFDKEVSLLESLGISSHLVLYGWPKWIMDDQDPRPKDMRWAAADPRWEDLTVETAWDRYLKKVAEHYKGRAVIHEIENEPEFDKWERLQDEYAAFTIRSARVLKKADPSARVMVNNVYGIPSGLNRRFLEKGGAKHIDIISWHDYHAGWLTDGMGIRRMRAALDALGGQRVEIWFNEGWAYTNTAVDEPLACTPLTAAEGTHAMFASVAEMTVAGQEKTVLFHTGYEQHGMSFWDYSGPGTMLWDWYGYPLPLVAAWNTLCHHVGLSERVALVRPEGANFCVFQDLRNGRGVLIAYADREAKADVKIELPFAGLTAEDIMGNAAPLGGSLLVLPKSGRPVILYDAAKTSGKAYAAKLEPLDRKNASFVSAGGESFRLPPAWEGKTKGSAEGNPAVADGKPVWRLDQVWPPEPEKTSSYRPLVWQDGWWIAPADAVGGQPKTEMKDGAIRMEFRARHGNPPAERICGLSFIAPKAGACRVSGSAQLSLWDGNIAVRLSVLRKTKTGATEIATLKLEKGKALPIDVSATLEIGDEIVLLPRPDGGFVGGDVTLRDLEARLGDAAGGGLTWRLPKSWEGAKAGSAEGNPATAGGKAVWRLDQLWPSDPIMAGNYRPMVWLGGNWGVTEHGQGGHPSAIVADGTVRFGSLGPWTGLEHMKTGALAFLAPKPGVYKASGTAWTKPWEGGAKSFTLAVLKKDTQRAATVKEIALPRDGARVPFEAEVELSAGHELLFMLLIPGHNNATSTTIEGLAVTLKE